MATALQQGLRAEQVEAQVPGDVQELLVPQELLAPLVLLELLRASAHTSVGALHGLHTPAHTAKG